MTSVTICMRACSIRRSRTRACTGETPRICTRRRRINWISCAGKSIKHGEHIRDIGCGWGSFAAHAARHYGARVTGITISREQMQSARERVRGLDVDIQFADYRDVSGVFDHIVSIGMFKHVGSKNYRLCMETTRRLLREDGLMLLHTINGNRKTCVPDPWIERHILPHGFIPSPMHITEACNGMFVIEDWHTLGAPIMTGRFARGMKISCMHGRSFVPRTANAISAPGRSIC